MDSQIESHKALTDRIHNYDTKIFCQIYHAGRQSLSVFCGSQPVAPSSIPCPLCREMPRELTVDEIKQIVKDHGDTARRVKEAGFDGVEVHMAHGYLLAEFMSPYSNKRTDEYGGSLQNRLRIVKEVVEDVRSKVGNDFPVIVRLSGDEAIPGGRNMEETRIVVQLLEEWGVDGIDVTVGVYSHHNFVSIGTMQIPHGIIVKHAEEIKKLVSIPVIVANRINDPLMAEDIIKHGRADFVGMGRGSLADPDLPRKARGGDLESILYCIGCLQGCQGSVVAGGTIGCLVNPAVGRELEIDYSEAPVARRVFVAGGGPGGMSAARAAALKGHTVSLYEKRAQLGGQFRSAAYSPHKGELAGFTSWQIRELDRLGVKSHLNTELTAAMVGAEKPDAVIVATGASPIMPHIPGIDRANVFNAQDVLLGNVETGNNIVIAGGGMVGAETAAHLALQAKKVCVVDMLPEIAADLDPTCTDYLLQLLDEYRVEQITSAKVAEICEEGVLLERRGVLEVRTADTIVIALGSEKDDKLLSQLDGLAAKVVAVGDAISPRKALQAIREGFDAGLNI